MTPSAFDADRALQLAARTFEIEARALLVGALNSSDLMRAKVI